MDKPTTDAPPSDRWPGAFGIFKPSLRTVAFNLMPFLVLLALSLVVQIPISLVGEIYKTSPAVVIATEIIGTIISIFLTIAITFVLLEASESKKIDLNEALNRSKKPIGPYVALVLLSGLILFGSFLLLVIPFFFVFPRIILASYFMLDQNLGVIDSLKASWNETRSHVSKVYGIVGVNILMALLIFTLIGIPVAIFLLVAYSAATILLYKFAVTGSVKDPMQTPIELPLPKA